MSMSEIRCIVDDRKVIGVLRLIKGLTVEAPVVLPVDEITNGANGHAAPSKTSIETLHDFLKSYPNSEIRAKQMCEACVAAGFTKNGYSYALSKLLEAGTLKKSAKGGVYKVVKHG